jgi:hypothetical protein
VYFSFFFNALLRFLRGVRFNAAANWPVVGKARLVA